MTDEGVDESKRATLRRFAALGAASPLVRFAQDSESDAPDAILGYVTATPGAHFSKVRDDLKLGTGETQHHLRRLEGEGAIESREDGDYRRFFPAGRFSEFEQVALGYLRRATPRGMVVALLRDPEATGADLAAELGVSRPTVSKHAARLEEAGLVSRADG
ncbi:MarR family transcriptional regulator, partial [Halobacteriales archaeon QH_1_68_42]